jgi:phenylacetate-coenzyme A ligase PaaK-like adenylate-forming protein
MKNNNKTLHEDEIPTLDDLNDLPIETDGELIETACKDPMQRMRRDWE